MDVMQRCTTQQARVASFLVELLSTTTSFIVAEDVEIRVKAPFLQRLVWDKFVVDYQHKPLFRRHLRMTYTSFTKLLDRIRELLEVDDGMAALRGGKIIPEIHLYATIRYLAGGSYTDICIFCGISAPSFYCILRRTMDAINMTLMIEFPSTQQQCSNLAEKFENCSHKGIIKNCVGACDGYLLSIATPRKCEAKNVRSYFSGHYQRYGLNVQACCDADCRFTYLGIGGPGVTKDRQGVKESGLFHKVQGLPRGFVCVSDCAYMPTEKMIPTFGGDLALKRDNDNFNFYLSQLRIRIEMAFGLMTKKWGILQRPLTNSLVSIKHMMCCIARLHNFCIDERLQTSSTVTSYATATTAVEEETNVETTVETTVVIGTTHHESLPTHILAEMHEAAEGECREILSEEYPGWSITRQIMVRAVKEAGLKRPVVTRKRKDQSGTAGACPQGSHSGQGPEQSQSTAIA
jgi:DDE superfamily endonuclease